MFAKAVERARLYTHPLVSSIRQVDGTLTSFVATYFFINKEGWALTAAHVLQSITQAQRDAEHIKEVNEMKAHDPSSQAVMDPKWITNHSFWFGQDMIRVSKMIINPVLDLALVKLENVPPAFLEHVATLADSTQMKPGTSLCRLGYSFINIAPKFNNPNFAIPSEINNAAPFPNDGIFTRFVNELSPDKKLVATFLETSTPGLKGQSGGPVFDTEGNVYGMQSKTAHLPLGFSPTITVDGVTQAENQFLNVGWAVPSSSIIKMLTDNKVSYEPVEREKDGSFYVIN